MATVTFSVATDTNLFDGSAHITESGLYWALLTKDQQDASLVSSIVEQNTNLDITNGVGTLTTATATAGDYILLVQSNTTNEIGSYLVTVT